MSDRNRWFSRRNLLLALLGLQLVCLLGWAHIQPEAINLAFVIPENEQKFWQGVSHAFEREHPGIRIRLVSDRTATDTTDERAAIYMSDFDSEIAQHDLVYMDITWTPEFAKHLKDLRPLMERDSLAENDFLASEIQAGEYRGQLYRLPMRADIGLLFYRKDWLTDIGAPFPSSLPELRQTIQTLQQQKDVEGYVWQGKNYEGLVVNFMEMLGNTDGSWIDTTNNNAPMLNSDETIAAVEILHQLIQQNISPTSVTNDIEDNSLEKFITGKAAFVRGWPYFYQTIAQQGLTDRVGVALPSSFIDGEGKGCRGGWGFGIPENAAHPEAAWEAIKYFTSAKAQEQFVLKSGYLPSRVELFSDPDIVAQYPYMPKILNYLETSSVFRPSLEQYSEASEILHQAISDVLQGHSSADAAMQRAQNKTLNLFNAQ